MRERERLKGQWDHMMESKVAQFFSNVATSIFS